MATSSTSTSQASTSTSTPTASLSGARGPPQFLKKTLRDAGANENLSGLFAAIPGIAPRVAPRIVGFVLITREWNFQFRELLREYPGTLRELQEWPFHSESVFPEIGVVPRLLSLELAAPMCKAAAVSLATTTQAMAQATSSQSAGTSMDPSTAMATSGSYSSQTCMATASSSSQTCMATSMDSLEGVRNGTRQTETHDEAPAPKRSSLHRSWCTLARSAFHSHR